MVARSSKEVRWSGILEADKTAVLVCSDGGIGGEQEKIVYQQQIEYTDFPLASIRLYNDAGILCLPSER